MSYNFSFDKKTIAFLLGGFAFVGIMLFIAGLLVGTNWRTEQPALASAKTSEQPAAAAPAPAPAPVSTEPVLKAPPPKQETAAPEETVAPAAAPSPAKQSHSVAGLESTKESAPTQYYNGDGEVKIVERAKPVATKADDLNRMNQSSFSIQVGVFLDEKDANQLVGQLQNKGYTPFVLATNDDESRTWYAVRIGTYTDKNEATRAASNIAAQEKIKTFVRPLGSL